MIVTGEASGDMHGANLVKAMLESSPELTFSGMGGPELERVGVKILFDAGKVAVVGIAEVLSHLRDIRDAQRVLKAHLRRYAPDLLILIDLPDFNLRLAAVAKSLSIPVFYYICPQVWGWRSSRVKTIAERVDQAGVILPFEQEFLRHRGVEATYVGHPLLDTVRVSAPPAEFRRHHGISDDRCCIGLLPGSRKKEISALLPSFLEAAKLLADSSETSLTFLIPLASTISRADLDAQGLKEYAPHLDVRVIEDERYDLMASCEAVVAASGTVTLELALLDIPMVVAYRLSPLTYFLGRMLVKLSHFSLVNLIAGREVVPELLQDQVTPQIVADHLAKLSFDRGVRAEMRRGLAEVRRSLGEEGASMRAARVALSMLEGKKD